MKSGANSRRAKLWTLPSGALALLYLAALLYVPVHLLLETHSGEGPATVTEMFHHHEEPHGEGHEEHHHSHPATDHEMALARLSKFSDLNDPQLAILPIAIDFALPAVRVSSFSHTDTGPLEHSPPRSPAQPRSPPLA